MIKGNELDVENIDFELLSKIGGKFLCFILFLNFKESLTSMQPDLSNYHGVWIKMYIFNGHVINFEKSKLKTADMWLIPLDLVTNYNIPVHYNILIMWLCVMNQTGFFFFFFHVLFSISFQFEGKKCNLNSSHWDHKNTWKSDVFYSWPNNS